jgi:hypothetical protein
MQKPHHDFQELFAQLGLPNTDLAIREFLSQHFLQSDERLSDAKFWNSAQAQFLWEGWRDDADWAVIIDRLDTGLRH